MLLVLYSYLKRFTSLCHLVLGTILGCAPAGGWIAMTGRIDLPPVLLGIAVLFWTAGFDIIYACQDYQFDIKQQLHSLPVKYGVTTALKISSFFHAVMFLLIISAGLLLRQNMVFYCGVAIVGVLLIYEHAIIRPGETENLNKAFFVVNSWVSVVLFVFTFLAKVWERWAVERTLGAMNRFRQNLRLRDGGTSLSQPNAGRY